MHVCVDKSSAVQVRSEQQRPAGTFQFADRRPEAEIHNRLLSLTQASPLVEQLQAIQARADNRMGLGGGAIQRFEGLDDEKVAQGKFGPVQRLEAEDGEIVQGKRSTVQREANEEDPVQGRFDIAQCQQEAMLAKNETGLPDYLKSGIESLSGMSMDHVRVHYNSSQPAQLNALAYAQGTDIHVAPGQEQHLPHEAWHVVQQAQGRVKPTMQMKEGVPVNDDRSLEHEADVMGARAASVGAGQLKLNELAHINPVSMSGTGIQKRKDGKKKEADEKLKELDLKQPMTPTKDDLQEARNGIYELKEQIQQGVTAQSQQKEQDHRGGMPELRSRWHNDKVILLRTGGNCVLHAHRTKEVEEINIEKKAAEIASRRFKDAQNKNKEIQEVVAQL